MNALCKSVTDRQTEYQTEWVTDMARSKEAIASKNQYNPYFGLFNFHITQEDDRGKNHIGMFDNLDFA